MEVGRVDRATHAMMAFQSAFAPLQLSRSPQTSGLASPEALEVGEKLLEAHLGSYFLPPSPQPNLAHFALRKRYFEDHVRAALDRGLEHLCSLGAGWDALCLGLAVRHPKVQFTEIDVPVVIDPKKQAMQKMGLVPANLRLLSRVLPVLVCPWLNLPKPDLVMAEGVLMYLEEDEVRDLLRRLHGETAPECRLVLSYVTGGPLLKDPALDAVRPWVAWTCEDPAAFLAECGWNLLEHPEPETLAQRYLKPHGLDLAFYSRVERVGLATRAKS